MDQETNKKKKKTILIISAIVIIIICMIMVVIQYIYQYVMCMFSFGISKACDSNSKHQTIIDDEITDVAKLMKQLRANVNDNVDVPGEYYEYIYPGMNLGGSFTSACGPYTGPNADIINAAAQKFGVDGQLVAAIAKQESGINHYNADGSVKVNPSSGATGMMQLMPETARWLGVDPNDLVQNVEGGAKYISMMLKERNGDVKLALASYNWGPGNVNKALTKANATTWDQVIAAGGGNKETNNYVANVSKYYEEFKRTSTSCTNGGQSVVYQAEVDDKVTAEILDNYLGGNLKGLGKYYVEQAKVFQISPAFLAAIGKHETGNGTSNLSKAPFYNLGGVKCGNNKQKEEEYHLICGDNGFYQFPDYQTYIAYSTQMLKNNYIEKNLTTVGDIQKKYCPDSDGGCENWTPNITKYMEEIYKLAGVTPGNSTPTPTTPTQPPGKDVIAELANGVFPMAKGTYDPFSDTWGAGRSYGGARTHEGNDIMAKTGTPLYAAVDGTITKKGWNNLGGWRLNLTAGDYMLYYAHMSQYAPGIAEGIHVTKGQLIGYVGATGYGPPGTTGQFESHLHFGIYKNGEAVNPYATLKYWETGAGPIVGGTTPPVDGKGIEEAELHLRALMEVDYYALGALDFSTITDPKTGKKETGVDRLETGKYKDTNVGKTWAIAKKLNFKGRDSSWSIRDKIMFTRTAVYKCYFIGTIPDAGWFWFDEDTCKEVNDAVNDVYGKDYIPEEDQGKLLKVYKSGGQTIVKNQSLKQILLDFEPYSLAEPGKTIPKSETYKEWIEFYLAELYKEYGVNGDFRNQVPLIAAGGVFQHPVQDGQNLITSPFGIRWGVMHAGIDYGVPRGTPVYAVEGGVVVEVRSGTNGTNGYGNSVMIKHTLSDGKIWYSIYGHLLDDKKNCPTCVSGSVGAQKGLNDYYDPVKKIQVKNGQTVTKGQLLAYSGNAGSSTGFHLHLSICSEPYKNCVDPMPFLTPETKP